MRAERETSVSSARRRPSSPAASPSGPVGVASAATGAREAANGEPAGPDAADGRERPGPEPGRRARGPIDRRRRKPETPRD